MSGTPPKSKNLHYFQDIHNRIAMPVMYSQTLRNNIKTKLNKKLKMDVENIDTSNIFGYREKKVSKNKNVFDAFTITLPAIAKLKLKAEKKNLNSLPKHLLFLIIAYMDFKDIVQSLHATNRHMRDTCNDTRFWKSIESTRPIPMKIRIRKTHCIVERRSKGKLFKGKDRTTGKACTLRKILLDVTNAGHDDGVPTSILRELSFMKEMDHFNMAKILGAEVNGRVMQICFEHYDLNMKEYMKFFVKDTGKFTYRMPIEKIKSIMYQLLEGISYLHHKGIMHRNLKIDNLLITNTGILKIADFSLCRMVTIPTVPYTPEDPKERERSGREARRLWYRAPELLFRKNLYSLEVDMWSIGCLLAEIVMGEPIFNGETEIEQLFRIFRFTGVPDNYTTSNTDCPGVQLPKWKRVYFGYTDYDKSSSEFQELIGAYVPGREHSLAKLRDLKDRIGIIGLDLLWKLLEVDPQNRITASEALKHPFFSDVPLPMKLNYSRGDIALPCSHFFKNKLKCIKTYPLGIPPPCHIASYVKFLRQKEIELIPDIDYMTKQQLITESMRSILVDWLVDVSVHFEVMSETLHFAISFIDRTLSITTIDKSKLQLVGVTCMKIADVFNENSKEYYRQENATEYAYITADEYKSEEVIEMEKKIITLLEFQMFSPTAVHFLKAYNFICHFDEKVMILSNYLADLLLLNYHSLKFSPSLRASAALFIATLSLEQTIKAEDLQQCQELFGWFSVEEFSACVAHVRSCWIESRNNSFFSRFDAVNNKYDNQQTLLMLRTMYAPHVQSSKLDHWFYTKTKRDSEEKCPMEIF